MEKRRIKKVVVRKYFDEKSHSHKRKLALVEVPEEGYKVVKEEEHILKVNTGNPET